jgi:hypothetical protein
MLRATQSEQARTFGVVRREGRKEIDLEEVR